MSAGRFAEAGIVARHALLTTPAEDLIVVEGHVEHGDKRGRTLGFPTANVASSEAVRSDGVYAGVVQIEPTAAGPTFVAAVSVGRRPTYYGTDGQRLLEAYLLGFSGDLYGRHVRAELHVRLRPQHRYVDSPTLVRQLDLDVQATRAWARSKGLDRLLAVDDPTTARSAAQESGSTDFIPFGNSLKSGECNSAQAQRRSESCEIHSMSAQRQ